MATRHLKTLAKVAAARHLRAQNRSASLGLSRFLVKITIAIEHRTCINSEFQSVSRFEVLFESGRAVVS
jgi:hypothetical protein